MPRYFVVMRLFLITSIVAALLAGAPLSTPRAEEVDLELVLAADGSGSIDEDELRLQRNGWADAITSKEVIAGIRDGMIGAIAVLYFEWGSATSQVIIADWHVIRDEDSARRFAHVLRTRPRGAVGYNSISAAVDFGVSLVETNSYTANRRIIDVSGDGPNYGGRPMALSRAEAVAKGFTINALAIRRAGGRPGGPGGQSLEDYYRQSVIGGPGAFVEVADAERPFVDAARRKLVQEIADRGGSPRRTADITASAATAR